VDRPHEIHDAYRLTRAVGHVHDVARRQLLNRYGVDVNILCTVHAANADHPVEVYRFFRDELKTEFIQFIPIVERTTPARPGAQGGAMGSDRVLSCSRP
jgi:uncharacterized protein